MKNNYLLLLALAAITAMAGCKKSEQTCQLGKSYLTDGSSTPAANVYYYNSGGQLVKITYTNRTTDTLVYNADTLQVWSFDENNVLTTTVTGNVNGNGYLANGVLTTYNGSGNVVSTQNITNTYNADGNLTQSVTGNSSTTINYTNGNSVDGTVAADTVVTQRYVFFHNSKENKAGINELTGTYAPYMGKPSKTLLDSLHVISATDTLRVVYSYSFDNNGYVTRTTQTTIGGSVNTKYFTYAYVNCNQ